MSTYTCDLKEDENGDLIMELPDGLMKETGWKVGDDLVFEDRGDGTFSMNKKEDTEYVLVDCISQYRMRYLVEVPKGKSEWALDTVTCEEAKEFSQLHLGETIVSHRVIPSDQVIPLCDEDNDWCKMWGDEKKFDAFVTKKSDYEG